MRNHCKFENLDGLKKTHFIFENSDGIQYKWIYDLLVFRHLVELSINVAQKE